MQLNAQKLRNGFATIDSLRIQSSAIYIFWIVKVAMYMVIPIFM